MTNLEKMQQAIIDSLKQEVRLLRKEIAGLREERKMFIDKDRPQWPKIVGRDWSDNLGNE